MSTQIHVPAKDKTPQIGYYRAGRQQARGTREEVEPAREPCRVPLAVRPRSAWRQRGVTARFLPGGGGGEGRAAGWGSAVTQPPRAGRPLGIPFPSLPPLLAPPRPSPRSDSAGPGPLCVTASLVSASDWTAVFTSLSDKVGSVWAPVSVFVRTCISAHLVSFSPCLTRSCHYACLHGLCVCLAPVSVFCLGLPLHHLRDHVCLSAHALLCLPSCS